MPHPEKNVPSRSAPARLTRNGPVSNLQRLPFRQSSLSPQIASLRRPARDCPPNRAGAETARRPDLPASFPQRTPAMLKRLILILLPVGSAALLRADALDDGEKAARDWMNLRLETTRIENEWASQKP